MQIDVLRPNATATNTGWTIVPSGTAHGVTSDNNLATYVQSPAGSNLLILTTPTQTPPANHERHRIVYFMDALASGANANVLMVGTLVAPGSPACAGTVFVVGGSSSVYSPCAAWTSPAFLPATGTYAARLSVQVFPNVAGVRVQELYFSVDNRAQPTFSAEVHDGAGVNRDAGIIADTSRPVLVFDSPDYDSLNARTWTVEVRTVPGGVVVFEASGTGTPPNVQSDPLPNGDYEADLQISSTIRVNDEYLSAVENVTFEIAFVAPASPVLTLTPILSPPSIEIDWVSDTATATTWDVNADVVTEIRRTDCNGTSTIYVERTGITAAEWVDRFMSLSYNGVFCDEENHVCQVCYEARYWGLVDDVLVTSDWSTSVCDDVANPTPGNAWMRGAASGDISICPDETFDHVRPFGVFQPIGGGIPTVVTGTPGGRDYSLDFAVTSEADLVTVEAILAQALFFYQPVEQADLWLAPANQSMSVVKVKRIRTVSVPCVAVNPQPTTDPASLF